MNRERLRYPADLCHQPAWPTTLRDGRPIEARVSFQDTSIPTEPQRAVHNKEETTEHSELSDYLVPKRTTCRILRVLIPLAGMKVANVSLYERPAKVQCPNVFSRSLPLPVHARESQVAPCSTSRNGHTSAWSAISCHPVQSRGPEQNHGVPRCCEETAMWAQRGRSTPSRIFLPNFPCQRWIPRCPRTHRFLPIQTGPQPSQTGDLDHGEPQSIQKVESVAVWVDLKLRTRKRIEDSDQKDHTSVQGSSLTPSSSVASDSKRCASTGLRQKNHPRDTGIFKRWKQSFYIGRGDENEKIHPEAVGPRTSVRRVRESLPSVCQNPLR